MKEILKKCLFLGSGLFCASDDFFGKIRERSKVKITIPLYHTVSDDKLVHLKHIISYKNCSQFREDLVFFSSQYTFIGISELMDYVEGIRTLPPNPLLITFDDGLREFYENAVPIMEEFKAPAVVFVNTDFVGNRKMFYRHKASILVETISHASDQKGIERVSSRLGMGSNHHVSKIIQRILDIGYKEKELLDELGCELGVDFDDYLTSQQPYLSYENIEDILARGFFVGAHSLDHPEYDLLSLDQQLDQTTRSMNTLMEKEHLAYRVFASPFHDTELPLKYYNQILGKVVDVSFGIDGTLVDPVSRNFQRLNMEGEGKFSARSMLSAYYLVMILLRALGKEKIRRN